MLIFLNFQVVIYLISKHFMFKVHKVKSSVPSLNDLFQNISCLRFIQYIHFTENSEVEFQNISCLRFILYLLHLENL